MVYVYYIELKSGRVPGEVRQRLGNWKAEDLQKFTYPISEYVLDGLLPDEHYEVWITLVRITELVYNTGRKGLTADDREILQKLIERHNILQRRLRVLRVAWTFCIICCIFLKISFGSDYQIIIGVKHLKEL